MKPDQQYALNTAFILAASHGYNGIMHQLLQAGADIHANKDAALILAAEEGLAETVDYLLLRGADPQNALALRKAAQNDHRDTIRVLMKWSDEAAGSPSP
jgi:ankyrin repeat protein